MNFFNVAVVIGQGNYVGAYGYADDAELGEIIYVPVHKQLAPLISRDKPGRPMRQDEYHISRYLHTDGNTYLIGTQCNDIRKHNFSDVIEFAKGKKMNGFRWM